MKKILVKNKEAYSKYEILETFEAGIKLTGAEVKSVKLSQANLKGSYATIGSNISLMLVNFFVSPYKPAANSQANYQPSRKRKLLVTKKELNYFIGKLKEKGLSLVPFSIYLKNGIIKVELGLCRGKKKYEKREQIKKRDIDKDIRRALRNK